MGLGVLCKQLCIVLGFLDLKDCDLSELCRCSLDKPKFVITCWTPSCGSGVQNLKRSQMKHVPSCMISVVICHLQPMICQSSEQDATIWELALPECVLFWFGAVVSRLECIFSIRCWETGSYLYQIDSFTILLQHELKYSVLSLQADEPTQFPY